MSDRKWYLSIEQAIDELRDLVRCRCHPAYKDRGLHDPDCNCDSAEAVEVLANALPAVQPAHVSETPKSEHDAANVLTPATKGGAEPTDAQPDLTDPNVVHVNMLRGTIAKPTLEQIRHLYGDAVQIKMTMQDEAEAQFRWIAATKMERDD